MIDRTPPEKLQQTYDILRQTPSDINEHLETLRKYAARCEHVTEIGMRGAVSTTALLAAQPAKLVSWDIDPWAVASANVQALLTIAGRTKFQPRVGDSLEVTIEPTEFLFIDSLHTYIQLRSELKRHVAQVSRYLAFHDVITFGKVGEDGSEPGLRAAIFELQRSRHPFVEWTMVEDRENNNGLVVLQKIF